MLSMGNVENISRSSVVRILPWLYDGLWAVACAVVLVPVWTAPAFAYVDPSIMTYTIQAVAGVAVALSTVLGVAARRSRKKLMTLLDFDENARREIDPPVHRTDGMGVRIGAAAHAGEGAACEGEGTAATGSDASGIVAHAAAEEAADGEGKRAAKRAHRKGRRARKYAPAWRTRFIYALLACAFMVCTIFVVAPCEVVGGSAGSLVFSLADVWWVVALPAVGVVAVLALLLSALRGRIFNFFLVLVTSIGVAAYVQVLVLNYGMPIADGGTIVWAEHNTMMVVSSAVWIVIIVLSLLLSLFNRFRAQGVVALVSACLLVVQGVGVASLFIAPPVATEQAGGMDDLTHTNLVSQTESVLTEDGLYSVSSKSNVIVFVLDTYDQTLLNTVSNMNSHMLDEMTDFTEFTNCTGSMTPTRFAVPYLLTGELPKVGEDSNVYLANRYARGTFLADAQNAGYSVGLYTDSLQIGSLPEAEQKAIAATTINMHKVAASSLDFRGAFEALCQIALYRDAPWPLKHNFWYYTDQINGRIVSYNPDAEPGERVYTMNDPRYYGQLQRQGLAVDDDAPAGAFRFIHLLGAHYPYSIDEHANDLGTDNSTKEQQAQGSMHIVAEYLRQLKELGVYDRSTIIITADHGKWFLTPEPLTTTSTPIMLVKPAKQSGQASGAAENAQGAAVQKSGMPVSHHDYLPTVAQAMGLDSSKYGSGQTFFEVNDPDRVRTYLTTDSIGLRGIGWREYAIVGDSLRMSNWYETGNYWSIEE